MSYLSSISASKSENGLPVPSTHAQTVPLNPNNDPAAAQRPSSRRSRRSQRAVPSPVKAAALLAAFLPIPPVLAIIYTACGHSVLRVAIPKHFGSVPLISSIRAAATGGAILTLPLAVLLYLLFFPTKAPDPDDFFEDEELGEPMSVYASYGLSAVLALTLGAVSGALGTVCLPDNLMLSSGQAVEAGILGGAIVDAGLAAIAFTAFAVWWDLFRPQSMADS